MKGLVLIRASVNFEYPPYFLVNVLEDTGEYGLVSSVANMLPGHFCDSYSRTCDEKHERTAKF